MSIDPSIILAIEAAANADPENMALRSHLASLLLAAGRCPEALAACRVVLSRRPDDFSTLDTAARSAEMAGDLEAAAGYRKLHEALGWKQTQGMLNEFDKPALLADQSQPGNIRSDEEVNSDLRSPARVRADGTVAGEDPSDSMDAWGMERVTLTLADVAGMEDVKRRLQLAFLGPLKNPDMMRMYGKSLRGGLLLYGPPGCGKTYVARATAGELGANSSR